jgi:hypothetical protein
MSRLTKNQAQKLRNVLCGMRYRCCNPKSRDYADYGGRGIKVCDEWLDKENGHKNFREWAIQNGWKEGLSIDRIDVNGNYEPSNCRWATPKEQANNRRDNLYVTIKGVTKTAKEWAEQVGIKEASFISRLEYGWDEDRLLEPRYKPLKMTKAQMSKEIKEWRYKQEQGLMKILPCKIGDTLYINDFRCDYHMNFDRPYAVKVWNIVINGRNDFIDVMLEDGTMYQFYFSDIGETVFLTRSEAEEALAKMGGK